MLRTFDVPGVPLILLADVEEMQFGTPLADVLWHHDPILAHGGDMDSPERERADLVSTAERIKERLAVPQRESGGDIALADQHPADVASETEARELSKEGLELVPETRFCIEDAEREQRSSTR